MKKNVFPILKIIVSVILLIYLFTIVPLPKIISSLASAKIILVLAGLILSATVVFLSAAETKYLTKIQGLNLSVFSIIKIHLATSFYSLFLPGILSGGVIKWYKFSRRGTSISAASVILFNRFLEIYFTVSIGFLFLLASSSMSYENKYTSIWFLAFLCLTLIYGCLFSKKLSESFEKLFLKFFVPKAVMAKAERLIGAIKQFQNMQIKHHFQILGLLFLYHSIGIIVFFCFTKSLNIDISFWTIGWMRSAVNISVMIPLSFFGLGIREGLLVFLLGQYCISASDSMALSFLLLSRSLLIAFIGGVFEFIDFVFRTKLGWSVL
jgi:uncharacterized protein (TIRG00374 family)